MKFHHKFLNYFVVAITLTALLGLPYSSVLANDAGPYNPALGSNVPGISNDDWVNPGEITSEGSPYAMIVLSQGHRNSNYLQGTQYGFSVPTDATIMGIEVSIYRTFSGHPNIVDNVVRLVKGGAIVGNNKADPLPWLNTFTLATYGGATDLWGTTWTPAEVNAIDFGAVLAVYRDNNANQSTTVSVDTLKITVYYGYLTSSGVVCGDGSAITYGESVTCLATVSRQSGSLTPTGTVDWASDGSGTFVPNPCTLSGADGVATCTATYTPTSVGSGTHVVTATYSGDGNFNASNASQSVTVLARPITATADPQSKVYGAVDPLFTYDVTQGSLVFSDTFTGTLTREPGDIPGSYAILQGSLALPASYDLTYVGDYLTIEKANPTCPVSGYTVPYDRLEHMATGSCTGVFGENLEGLDLSGTAHTDAGIYTDTWTYTDITGNYNDITGTVKDEISRLGITVTADAKSKVFGQPDPELTYQVTSGTLLAGDSFSGSLARQPGERPGVYQILQGSLALPVYYEITFVGADFTITGGVILLPVIFH